MNNEEKGKIQKELDTLKLKFAPFLEKETKDEKRD